MKNRLKKAIAVLLALSVMPTVCNVTWAETLLYNKETHMAEPTDKSVDELETSPDQYELINGVWYDKYQFTEEEMTGFRNEGAKDTATGGDDESDWGDSGWGDSGWGSGDDTPEDGDSGETEIADDGTEILGDFEEALTLCVGMGILQTDSDGLYLPDELFSHDDLNKMIEKTVPEKRKGIVGFSISGETQITPRMLADYYVCLLGYQAYSNKQTPSVRTKILKGIKGKETEPATRKDAAQIIYNALNINTITQGVIKDKIGIEMDNKLFDELDMVKIEGLMNGTEMGNYLTNDELDEGFIQIARANYMVDTNAWNKYLGYYVTAYAEDTDDGLKIISMVKNEKKADKSVMRLDTENLSKSGDDKLTFEADDGKEKNYTIDKDAAVVVNGEFKDKVSSFNLNPEDYDTLSLINTDSDSDYDIIALEKFELLDCTLITENVIASADNSTSDIKDLKTYIEFNGANTVLNKVKLPAVAKVKKNSYAVEIYLSNITVEGVLRSVSKDEIKLADDDTVYKLNKNSRIKVLSGMECLVRFTHDGKVAFIDALSEAGLTATGRNYAYLRKVTVDDGDEKVYLRLYLLDGAGTWVTMPVSQKVYFTDGASAPTNQDGPIKRVKLTAYDKRNVFENLEPQLITYEKNSDGEISSIGTARDLVGTGITDENNFSKNGELRVFRRWSETFLGKNNNYVFNKKTMFLTVPFDRTLEDDYKLTPNTDEFSGDRAEIYDVNDGLSIQGVVVKYNPERPVLEISKEKWAIMITDIDHTLNEDDEEIIKIDDIHHKNYWFEDPNAEIAVASDVDITQSVYGNTVKTPSDLKVGDIIIVEFQVMRDGSRKITVFALVLRTSEMEINCPNGFIDTESYGWIVNYGTVIRSDPAESYIVANCSGSGTDKSLNKPVYRQYNIWNHDIKRNEVAKVGVDNVKPGDTFVNVVRTWSGAPIFVILDK